MEEISSLDSFQTDDAESTPVERLSAQESQQEKNATTKEDYDQMSYEADENSTATSGDVTQRLETENREEAVTEEQETSLVSSVDTAEEHQQETDFEVVDAQISNVHSSVNEESDMLGDADLTLGNTSTDKNVENENDEDMDTDQIVEELEKKRADETNTPLDAEMVSDDTNSPSTYTDQQKTQENTTAQDESMETYEDGAKDNNLSKDTPDAPNDEHNVEDEEEEEEHQEEQTLDKSDNKNIEEEEQHQEEEDEVDADPEDEPVENVQEPEESDICLIPDDTETQMTEEEKEQAILVRQNADKAEEEEKYKENSIENIEKSFKLKKNKKSVKSSENEDNETASDGEEALVEEDDDEATQKIENDSNENDSNARIPITWFTSHKDVNCSQCNEKVACKLRYMPLENPSSYKYICSQNCCDSFLEDNGQKFYFKNKKISVEETLNEEQSTEQKCLQCSRKNKCKYFYEEDDENYYICSDGCFEELKRSEPDKYQLKPSTSINRDSSTTSSTSVAAKGSKKSNNKSETSRTTDRETSFERHCAECAKIIQTQSEKTLMWETMDFCNEICLGKYQLKTGSSCQTCGGEVPNQALGKYCVRFGFHIRQFCCASCLNEFKKGLKTCTCCQKDISSGNEGFLAPVGDKQQFRDFCSQDCLRNYDSMCNPKKKLRTDNCTVCKNEEIVRVEMLLDDKIVKFCSNPCFSAFKFVSHIAVNQCGMCSKYFELKSDEAFTIYTEHRLKLFCSRICMNVYCIVNRSIVSCQWCKVKKYNFDMIYKEHEGQDILMCSLNCLTLFGVSVNAFSRTVIKCDSCNNSSTPQYHLTMSDASVRNFCTYQCVMQFQSQFSRTPLTLDGDDTTTKTQRSFALPKDGVPFPTGLPKRVKPKMPQSSSLQQLSLPTKKTLSSNTAIPIISTVSSLANNETENMGGTLRRSRTRGRRNESPTPAQTGPPISTTNNTVSTTRGRPRKGQNILETKRRS